LTQCYKYPRFRLDDGINNVNLQPSNCVELFMLKQISLCLALCAGTTCGLAQQGGARAEHAKKSGQSGQVQSSEDAQQRRAALRAAVRARADDAPQAEAPSNNARQLSQQELVILRQQLRQQRR
jgi:hypothetical protein